jgi:hypothetical protein
LRLGGGGDVDWIWAALGCGRNNDNNNKKAISRTVFFIRLNDKRDLRFIFVLPSGETPLEFRSLPDQDQLRGLTLLDASFPD